MTNIAISYARYSSVIQGEGDSLRRQAEAAAKYAEANGLVIDHARSFRDLGVSAWDRSNVNKGALGLFLQAIERKQIPVGATLIIESFDRLSRAKPMDALGIFTQIINAGITIVTLTQPPRAFTRKTLDDNPFQLMEAVMDMHRANAESTRKSQLVSAAWASKKVLAQSGALMSGRAPHWIEVSVDPQRGSKDPKKRTARLIPERVKVIKRIIKQAKEGVGNATIIRQLHADKIPAWSASGLWQPSYIQKLLTNPALYGGIKIDGEIIEGYYPAVIKKDEFHFLCSLRSDRATRKTTNRKGGTVTNLFSGLMKCGYCGSSMNVAGYKSLAKGYERKYVACHGARTNKTKDGSECRMRMWFLDELEPTLLFWLTELDYSKLVGTGKTTDVDEARIKLADLEGDLSGVITKLENVTAAIEDGAKGMTKRYNELELQQFRLEKLVQAQRDQVVTMTSREGGGASRMAGLRVIYKQLRDIKDDTERRALRERLSAAINSAVNQITLYPSGHSRSGEKSDRFIDIAFSNGATRRIEAEEVL